LLGGLAAPCLLRRVGLAHGTLPRKQTIRSSMNANHELDDVEEEEQENVEEEDWDEEVDEEDGDEEDSDEDEEEDSDEDNEDLTIVSNLLALLEGSAREDAELSFQQNGELDIIAFIGQLTDQGMAMLVDLLGDTSVSEESWDHLVKAIIVDVGDSSHDMKVAIRITCILDCLGLSSLERFLIVEESHDLGEGSLHPWKPFVVDHYITWMATATSITHPERLFTLHLGSLGYDPKVWDPFVSRFSSFAEVYLYLLKGAGRYPNCTLHATALALSLRRLSNLRLLQVQVLAAGVLGIVSSLFRGIASLPKLENFSCKIPVGTKRCDSCAKDFELVLQEIGSVLAHSPSLKQASIVLIDGSGERFQDVGVLFDQLRFSSSITRFMISDVAICEPKQTSFHKWFLGRAKSQLELYGSETDWTPSNPSITNKSIKTLVLDDCSIGKSYSSVFSSFEGVEDVTLKVENWFSRGTQLSWSSRQSWSMLFRTHPQLKSFAVGTVDLNNDGIDDEAILAALVASLDLATSLHDLTVCTNSCPRELLPSLEHLLRKCNEKLTLQHDGVNEGTAASLCAGLRAAPFLTNLHLTVAGEEMTDQTVVSILQSLHENRTIKTFHGKFLLYSPVEAGILDLVLRRLLSTTSVLESFGLEVLLRQRLDDTYIEGVILPNYTELVVVPIARSLADNRALKVLCLKCLKVMEPSSFALLSGMLKTNVTLERIKFHDLVKASKAKDEIEWFLTLNRYKRRCLVKESRPTPVDGRTGLNDQNPFPFMEVLPGSDHRPPVSRLMSDRDPLSASDPDSLPGGVWSSVLERIATDRREDVMYYFLRRTPKSLFVSSGRGLKRDSPSNRSNDVGPDGIDGPDTAGPRDTSGSV
jgi:hypothetical protein